MLRFIWSFFNEASDYVMLKVPLFLSRVVEGGGEGGGTSAVVSTVFSFNLRGRTPP